MRKQFVHAAHPRYFDNGPIQRMQHAVMSRVVKLSWVGCEVKEIRCDEFKATIRIEPHAAFVAQYSDKGFGVIEEGALRIVWREPGGEAGA
jgi:hypothetical protein